MEILFCDRCHESIPDADLESGKSVRVGGRLLHVSCALARATPGPGRTLTFVLALVAAGLAAYAVVQLKSSTDRSDDTALAARWTADVRRSDGAVRQAVDDRVAQSAAALARDLDAKAEERNRVLKSDIEREVAKLDGKVGALVEADQRRFEAIERAMEKRLQEISGWVKEVRDLAARSATTSPAPVRETPPPTPEPQPPTPSPTPGAGPAGGREEASSRQHDAEVDLWISRLKDPDTGVSFSATYRLKELKDLRAVPPLIETLKTQRDFYTRLGAATALGELRACDAVPALIDALEDKEELVQTAAGEALTAITGRDARVMVGLTKKERRQLKEEWGRWWKENESEVRRRLGQAAPTTPK